MRSTPFDRRVIAAVIIALVAGALGAPASSAQVHVPGGRLQPVAEYSPSLTVTPATGLRDGDEVQVDVADFAPATPFGSAVCRAAAPLTVDDCDLAQTLVTSSSDATGNDSFARPVSRYLATTDGITDCAVDACVLAIATFALSDVASTPLAFDSTPVPSALDVTLGGPAYLLLDPVGPATIPATLACTSPTTVTVDFLVVQTAVRASSTVEVPCAPGTPQAITSDLTGSFAPGPAEVLIRAHAGSDATAVVGAADLESSAAALAVLQARLADPTDTSVIPDLLAALAWRLEHNPVFAQVFWEAVLAPPG